MKAILICASVILYGASGFARTSAIVENWSRNLVLTDNYKLTVKEFFRVRVLDEHGYDHAVFRDYHDSFKKIRNLRVAVFDKNNNKVKSLTRLSALDLMLNPSYSIGDARMLILDPEYRNYPFTVEVEVETAHDGFLGFPLWMPRYSHDLEVLKAEMTLQCDKDFNFKSLELNGVDKPTVRLSGKSKIVRWLITGLPAVNRHLTYKSLASEQPKVHLAPEKFMLDNVSGEMSTWAAFGEWYRKLNLGRRDLSETTRGFLDSVRVLYPDDRAGLAKALYKHMQSRMRYISIQLGIGGFQAISALEVERSGYGDCKGLTNYFAALLDYCQIPSNHVLIYAGDDVPDLIPDFPSNQFNHVFLAVPLAQDTLWFESTSQNAPAAYTGTFTDDRFALWIDSKRSQLIRMPALTERQSIKRTSCRVRYDTQGSAGMQMKVTQSGKFYDEAEYYINLKTDKIQEFNYNKFFYKDFQIQAFNFFLVENDKPLLNLIYKINVNGLGNAMGGKFIMPAQVLPAVEKDLSLDFLNKKIEITRGFTITDSVTVEAPPGFRFLTLPENTSNSSPFGNFEMRFKLIDHETILITRNAVILKGTYRDDKFDGFNQWLQTVRAMEQRRIVLPGKT